MPGVAADEHQGLELQISLAELALARYREAYAIELNLNDPRPPHRPGPRSGTDGAEKANGPGKKGSGKTRAKGKLRNRIVHPVIARRIPLKAPDATRAGRAERS